MYCTSIVYHTNRISLENDPSSMPKNAIVKTLFFVSLVVIYILSKSNFSFSFLPPNYKRPVYSQVSISFCILVKHSLQISNEITESPYLTLCNSNFIVASFLQHNRHWCLSFTFVNSIIFFSILCILISKVLLFYYLLFHLLFIY